MNTPPPRSVADLRVALAGMGRLGGSLASALRTAGATVVAFLDTNSAAADQAADRLGLVASPGWDSLLSASPHVIFLTVPDSVIAPAAQQLAEALRSAPSIPAVVHCSGVTPVEALAPCADAGALTLSFHPLQTFSDAESGAAKLKDAAVAVTPGPRGGFELGELISLGLGAKPFLLSETHRALYHAAACVASNYLVALEGAAESMFIAAGLPAKEALAMFLPLVHGAVDNLAAQGSVGALTGPLSRGDMSTIERHLQALADDLPRLLPLYRVMGLTTLNLVRSRGQLPAETIHTLEQLLSRGEHTTQ